VIRREWIKDPRSGASGSGPHLFPPATPAYDSAMSAHPKFIVLDRLQTGESANPSPENILAGIPRVRASTQYDEPTQQFFCGIWTSTAGQWRVRYTEHEFCVIIEGRVRLESASGEKHEFRAGDAFVVPAGFEGIWEVTEPCKKWYSIFEPKR
jgi:uncharacterized cupin superfamily protein